ncbi:hypothetical protein TREMEDRAFT_57675, partial [Tremella mesenterica DSM 1558]|uniref:uncharacterized protein n=1 Tax=Tremella mesenterica (strain ATCC 24925 / CBS 8224 / DSM 1558 / NBRC 9311 / NRRL Y-6157 / RJB 2259-6 / UBC 559-6) TaxID=578456 RepID=UPI00032D39A7
MAQELLACYHDLHSHLHDPERVREHLPRWTQLQKWFAQVAADGTLSRETARAGLSVSKNISSIVTRILELEDTSYRALAEVSACTTEIMEGWKAGTSINLATRKKRSWASLSSPSPFTASKRPRPLSPSPETLSAAHEISSSTLHHPTSPGLTPQFPHSSIPPFTTLLSPPTDPIRTWFISHLASPYPTPLEKVELATSANITTNKLDSDLVNWRRRSGWANVRDKYCGGNKHRTERLIEDVLSGKERRKEILRDVEKVRAYL